MPATVQQVCKLIEYDKAPCTVRFLADRKTKWRVGDWRMDWIGGGDVWEGHRHLHSPLASSVCLATDWNVCLIYHPLHQTGPRQTKASSSTKAHSNEIHEDGEITDNPWGQWPTVRVSDKNVVCGKVVWDKIEANWCYRSNNGYNAIWYVLSLE